MKTFIKKLLHFIKYNGDNDVKNILKIEGRFEITTQGCPSFLHYRIIDRIERIIVKNFC